MPEPTELEPKKSTAMVGSRALLCNRCVHLQPLAATYRVRGCVRRFVAEARLSPHSASFAALRIVCRNTSVHGMGPSASFYSVGVPDWASYAAGNTRHVRSPRFDAPLASDSA